MATENPNPGVRKAAVLLRSLPKTQRTQLIERLEPPQAAAVVAAMNELRDCDNVEQEAVSREFAKASSATLAKSQAVKAVPFEFLHDLPTDRLLGLIADEHPQAIALILSHLLPRRAADVLAKLTPEQQIAVVWRMATATEVSSDVVRDVEEGLERRLFNGANRPAANRGIVSLVKILNVMEPVTERRLLGDLAGVDPRLIGEIRREIFGADVAACGEWDFVEAAG